MLRIPCENPDEFERNLTRFIATEAGQWRRKITYIDCRNTISQYLFSRPDLQHVFEHLFVTRIDRAYDLLDLFRTLPQNGYANQSHYILVSPYSHLLEGFTLSEEKNWHRMWEKSIERIEQRWPVHVVLMGE